MINWKITPEDHDLTRLIAERALRIMKAQDLTHHATNPIKHIEMDLTAVHLNIMPLRLADLLAADDFNLMHDVMGIDRHLVRTDPPVLKDHFIPRFHV